MIFLLIFFGYFYIVPSFAHADPVVLYPGHTVSLPVSASGPVYIEKKGIIGVADHGRTLKITGKKTGTTAVKFGGKSQDIVVLRQNAFGTYQKLKNWLKEKRGPEIAVEDQKIYIRGKFLTYVDWRDLAQFTNESDEFSIQAEIDSSGKDEISRYLKNLSEKNNLPYSDLNILPTWEISVASTQKNNIPVYKKIFSPYGIKINHSTYALSNIPMIEVSIFAAEVKRHELTQMGVQWPASTPFQVLPNLKLSPETLTATLDHLEQNGWGKVLASPTLLTQSGQEATFHSGGEFPIKSSNQYNSSVSWKKYGILLKIKPQADFSGKMTVQIDCEVSMIDASNTIDGVPGLLTNRIASHFNLSESRTIALSGLLREEWGNSRQGLPGLLNIPILSSLFSSENYRNNKSELVFFVTPRIVR